MAHTPAPWQRFDNGGVISGGKIEHAYGPGYADCVWGPEGPGRGLIADCSPNSQAPTETSIANARLIAEAPHLLEDLTDLLIHISMGWELDTVIERAMVHAKAARGEL